MIDELTVSPIQVCFHIFGLPWIINNGLIFRTGIHFNVFHVYSEREELCSEKHTHTHTQIVHNCSARRSIGHLQPACRTVRECSLFTVFTVRSQTIRAFRWKQRRYYSFSARSRSSSSRHSVAFFLLCVFHTQSVVAMQNSTLHRCLLVTWFNCLNHDSKLKSDYYINSCVCCRSVDCQLSHVCSVVSARCQWMRIRST